MNKSTISLIFAFFLSGSLVAQEKYFRMDSGNVHFISEAPLETIEASTSAVQGILEKESKRLAFTIPTESFQGFNSPLQRIHFLENYMESDFYPNSTFSGRIIEDIDLSEPGNYEVRVKGQLSVHGVIKERIITGNLQVEEGRILIQTDFTIPLSDHNIVIPKVVHQKIAPTIKVRFFAEMH